MVKKYIYKKLANMQYMQRNQSATAKRTRACSKKEKKTFTFNLNNQILYYLRCLKDFRFNFSKKNQF